MSEQILSSLIAGAASIISAAIATLGVYIIVSHRKTVIKLCENIDGYHQIEHKLVSKILELKNEEFSDHKVIKRKGLLRKELLGDSALDSMMTAKDARKIKKRYFG